MCWLFYGSFSCESIAGVTVSAAPQTCAAVPCSVSTAGGCANPNGFFYSVSDEKSLTQMQLIRFEFNILSLGHSA